MLKSKLRFGSVETVRFERSVCPRYDGIQSEPWPWTPNRRKTGSATFTYIYYIYIFLVFSSWWCSTFCKSTIQFWRFFLLSVLPHSEAVPPAFPLVSGSGCVFLDPKWHWRSQTQPGSGRFPPQLAVHMDVAEFRGPTLTLPYISYMALPTSSNFICNLLLGAGSAGNDSIRMIKNQMFACMIMHDPSNSSHFY